MRKPDNPLDNPTRRQYVEAILAASVVGAAGCSEANTTTSQQDTTEEELTIRTPEQDTETATATDTTEGEETTTTEETPTGPPMSERLTVTHTNIPAQSDVNKWQTGDNSAGDRWMYELMGAKDIAGNLYLSGHSWDSPWIEEFDEITIPTVIEDYRLEPPFDYYLSFDDRFTYWDGSTSLDAQAELYDRYMYYAMGGNVFNETATFNNQTLSQYELHSWRDKGNVGGQAPDPTNELILRNDAALEIHPENSAPFHPAYTEPYVQQFRDASTTDAANTIMQQVEGDVVDFFRLAEEGWGSGPYQFESPDDISSSNAVLSLRDDHPNEHIQIPELEILWAEGSRQQVIENQGDIDMNNGVVTDSSGPINRQTLPDYIQEVDRWFSTVGQQMIFNFNNKHLKRLWVRRAIAAAVDWEQTAINGASPDTVETISSQTGLLSTMNRSTFSEEFLNSLSNYPMGADTDLATEYMQKGGYTKQGGSWVGPDGDQASIKHIFIAPMAGQIQRAQTIKANLDNFGISVNIQGMDWNSFPNNLENKLSNWDSAQLWADWSNFWDVYWTNGQWWANPLVSGDPNDTPKWEVDAETAGDQTHDTHDNYGRPLEVQIPSEPGSLEAPEGPVVAPDLSNGVSIDVADLIYKLRSPDVTEEEMLQAARKCARYHNYYLPNFVYDQSYNGLRGNVRDFNFGPQGHGAHLVGKGTNTMDYQGLAGIVQLKYDEEFPSP